jgi:hypothetical protein
MKRSERKLIENNVSHNKIDIGDISEVNSEESLSDKSNGLTDPFSTGMSKKEITNLGKIKENSTKFLSKPEVTKPAKKESLREIMAAIGGSKN